jgi:hypothetical protein
LVVRHDLTIEFEALLGIFVRFSVPAHPAQHLVPLEEGSRLFRCVYTAVAIHIECDVKRFSERASVFVKTSSFAKTHSALSSSPCLAWWIPMDTATSADR